MPKCTLEFDTLEDEHEMECALKGAALACAIWEFQQEVLRPIWKHGEGGEGQDIATAIHLSDELNRILSERDLHGVVAG